MSFAEDNDASTIDELYQAAHELADLYLTCGQKGGHLDDSDRDEIRLAEGRMLAAAVEFSRANMQRGRP